VPAAQPIFPAIDTYISDDAPEKAYSQREQLKVDRTPPTWSLLRFELPRGARARRALLRLYAATTVRHGGAIYTVPSSWDAAVTWQSRPVLGAQVAEIGRIRKGSWISIDVTGALDGSRVITLAIVPTSDDVAGYHTSESRARYAPRLIVEP
jgi:hypothetical protein